MLGCGEAGGPRIPAPRQRGPSMKLRERRPRARFRQPPPAPPKRPGRSAGLASSSRRQSRPTPAWRRGRGCPDAIPGGHHRDLLPSLPPGTREGRGGARFGTRRARPGVPGAADGAAGRAAPMLPTRSVRRWPSRRPRTRPEEGAKRDSTDGRVADVFHHPAHHRSPRQRAGFGRHPLFRRERRAGPTSGRGLGGKSCGPVRSVPSAVAEGFSWPAESPALVAVWPRNRSRSRAESVVASFRCCIACLPSSAPTAGTDVEPSERDPHDKR